MALQLRLIPPRSETDDGAGAEHWVATELDSSACIQRAACECVCYARESYVEGEWPPVNSETDFDFHKITSSPLNWSVTPAIFYIPRRNCSRFQVFFGQVTVLCTLGIGVTKFAPELLLFTVT